MPNILIPYWQRRQPPQLPRKLPPQITAVPVDNPPFPGADETASNNAIIISSWRAPDWPYVFLAERGRLQPYEPGKLSPGIPGMSVDTPPFAPEEIDQHQGPIVRQWQPPDPLPTIPRKLSPGIPGQSIDPPPFAGADEFQQIIATITVAWRLPDPQPWLPGKLSPGIPGMSVDNPPGLRPAAPQVSPPASPLPTLNRPYPQPAVVVTASGVPYSLSWLPTLLAAWSPTDPLPTLPRLLNAGFLAVPVNDPPFMHRERTVQHAVMVDANKAPPPLPFMGGRQPLEPIKLNPTTISVAVNNPPFTHWGRVVVTASITAMTQPPDPQPFIGGRQPLEPKRLNPTTLDVPVNNPPFGSRTHLPSIVQMWQDPVPPQVYREFYIQPFIAVTYVPYSQGWLPTILNSWIEPTRAPDLPRKLSPGIPGQSVDNPPGLRARVEWPFWDAPSQPQPKLSYVRVETTGQPFLRVLTATAISWIPADFRIEPQRRLPPSILAAPVDNPPFMHRGRLVSLPNTLLTWQPPDPLPTLAGKLPPQVLAVPVNNPPFDMRARVTPSIIQMWQPEAFVFRPPYVPTARFIQPFLGVAIIAKPSLVGKKVPSTLVGQNVIPTLKGSVENN